MKFLAIDTSGKYLSVIAYNGERTERIFLPDCAAKHSVVLMDEIDGVFARAHMRPSDCDFFCAVTGPGSFTGIRIGISTVKGLCSACGKEALAVTSFDCLAYAERNEGKLLALVNAGHGRCYVCGYDEERRVVLSPEIETEDEIRARILGGYTPVAYEKLFEGCFSVNPAAGLERAAVAKRNETIPAGGLSALYLQPSSAERNFGVGAGGKS